MNTLVTDAQNNAAAPPPVVKAPDTRVEERESVRQDSATRARHHRALMAVLTCLISMHFVGPYYAMAWMALVLVYELAAPKMLAQFVTAYQTSNPERARSSGIALQGFGASVYVLGWLPSALTGHPGALYFAAIWLAAAMIHALVYNTSDKLVFITAIAPGLGAAFIVPFLTTTGSLLLPIVLAMATARMLYTTWTAHQDRLALVSSVNLNRKH